MGGVCALAIPECHGARERASRFDSERPSRPRARKVAFWRTWRLGSAGREGARVGPSNAVYLYGVLTGAVEPWDAFSNAATAHASPIRRAPLSVELLVPAR